MPTVTPTGSRTTMLIVSPGTSSVSPCCSCHEAGVVVEGVGGVAHVDDRARRRACPSAGSRGAPARRRARGIRAAARAGSRRARPPSYAARDRCRRPRAPPLTARSASATPPWVRARTPPRWTGRGSRRSRRSPRRPSDRRCTSGMCFTVRVLDCVPSCSPLVAPAARRARAARDRACPRARRQRLIRARSRRGRRITLARSGLPATCTAGARAAGRVRTREARGGQRPRLSDLSARSSRAGTASS